MNGFQIKKSGKMQSGIEREQTVFCRKHISYAARGNAPPKYAKQI